MTDACISPLRQRMIEDMSLRHFGEKTQKDYIRAVKNLTIFLGRSPDTATAEDLRLFQLHLTENRVRAPSINFTVTALRFFFTVTLDRADAIKHLTFVAEPRKIPVVLSPEEVARFLEAAPGVKYKAAFSAAYGAGLRVSEVAALKVSDIDSERMLLRIEQGKGRKDRHAMLSPVLLELLRDWWRIARPKAWLFPGRDPLQPMSTRQLNRACHAAASMAEITKRVSPHTLRHYVASRTMSRTVTGLCNFGRKLRIAALRDPPMTRHSFVNATSCPESSAADLPGDNDSARRWAMRFWRGPVPSSQVLLPNRSVWSLPIHDRATGR